MNGFAGVSCYSQGNDSLDSSGEGRPRGAEVENPNQNKAICTSQTGLALLINKVLVTSRGPEPKAPDFCGSFPKQ